MSVFPIVNNLSATWAGDSDYGLTPPTGQALQQRTLLAETYASEIQWSPHYEGADTISMTRYQYQGHTIFLYLGNYTTQAQGKELIFHRNKLFDENFWRISSDEVEEIVSKNKHVKQMSGMNEGYSLKARIQSFNHIYSGQRLIAHWYRVGGHNTIGAIDTKLYEILGVLTGQRGASVVAVAMHYDDKQANEAKAVMNNFISDVYLEL